MLDFTPVTCLTHALIPTLRHVNLFMNLGLPV